jgi:hypothetical protein
MGEDQGPRRISPLPGFIPGPQGSLGWTAKRQQMPRRLARRTCLRYKTGGLRIQDGCIFER